MRTIVHNKIWHLFLAIVFLLMQSASAHVHLGSSHGHDGHDHYHSQIVHAHNITSHHADAFGAIHKPHTNQVVELGQDLRMQYGKCFSDFESQAVLVSSVSPYKLNIVTQSYIDNIFVFPSHHFYTNLRARAPPILFSSHI